MTAASAGLVAVVACLAVSGCAGPALPDDWADRQGLDRATIDAFPGRHFVVPHLPPPSGRAALSGSDAVGFGLELRRGDQVERWILTARVDEPRLLDDNGEPKRSITLLTREQVDGQVGGTAILSDLGRLEVRGHDADGTLGEATHPMVPTTTLAHGFAHACAIAAGRDLAALDDADAQQLGEAAVALRALLRVVRDDPLLAEILWKVVRVPSIWGMLGRMRLDVAIEPRFQDATPATPEQLADLPRHWLDLPVWRLPIRIDVNDEPVLLLTLLVQQPRAPLTLTAGCLALFAAHPTDPDLRFSMRVLDGGVVTRPAARSR